MGIENKVTIDVLKLGDKILDWVKRIFYGLKEMIASLQN